METSTTQPVMGVKKHPLFKWILVGSIMIVTNLFLNYALDVFYKAPKYEVFCPQPQVREAVLTQETCLAKGGQWNESTYPKELYQGQTLPAQPAPTTVVEVKGYCNEEYTCGKNYEETNKVYNRNVFIFLVIAGTVLLVGSIFVAGIEAVALGFSLAGILSLVIGTMRYWTDMDERLRVVVLGIALVALVWVGIKKFKN